MFYKYPGSCKYMDLIDFTDDTHIKLRMYIFVGLGASVSTPWKVGKGNPRIFYSPHWNMQTVAHGAPLHMQVMARWDLMNDPHHHASCHAVCMAGGTIVDHILDPIVPYCQVEGEPTVAATSQLQASFMRIVE